MTDRKITHAPGCWGFGPKHYECAVREIERLRKMHQDAYQRGLQAVSKGLREMYDAVQTVKRQDAWGNAQLTEALMEAEERVERAEAENKQLRAEVERLNAESEQHLRQAMSNGAKARAAQARAERLAEALRDAREFVAEALSDERAKFAGYEAVSDIAGIEATLQKIDAALGQEE